MKSKTDNKTHNAESSTKDTSLPFTDDQLRSIWMAKADNMHRAWAHFEAKDLHLTSMPFRVSMELTQNCNFKCIMCNHSWDERYQKYNPDYNMPLNLFEKLAEEFFPMAVNVDLHGFGETTILPHWPDIVGMLDRYPYIEWNIVTNLSLGKEEVWDNMLKHDFVIGVTCDGATAPTFETIRVGGKFSRFCDNMEMVCDIIRRKNSGHLYVMSTIQRKNAHEMRAIVELVHKFGLNEVQFHLVLGELDPSESFLNDDTFPGYANQAIDAGLDLGVTVLFNSPVFTRLADPEKLKKVTHLPPRMLPENSFHGAPWSAQVAKYNKMLFDSFQVAVKQSCFKPFSHGNVNHLGHMGTCNQMMVPEILKMGDLNQQTAAEVWNSDAYQDFRRQMLYAQPNDPRCQWCFAHRLSE